MLMNIPPTAPNVFNPGNILCSSTPIRSRVSRYTAGRSPVRDIQLDPNETPIKGHGVKRKTVPKSASSATKPQIRKPSAAVSNKLSLIRHTASAGAISASQGGVSVPTASAVLGEANDTSSSDHTESDSCNVPEARINEKRAEANAPVIKSTDTENDFPTSDFNNEAEMNDLNRTGGKAGMNTVSASNPVLVSGLKLSSSGHPLPVVRDETDSPKPTQSASKIQSVRSSGKPVLRQKVYTDETQRKSPISSEYHAPIPERKELLKHSPPSQKKEESKHSPLAQRRKNPVSRLIAEHDELMKRRSVQNISDSVASVSESAPRISHSAPNVSEFPAQKSVSSTKPSTIVSESFEDDLLFEDSPMPFATSHKIPRTSSVGEITSPLGLSRGSNGPLKQPHDPSLDLVLPAVMTAKSSDLTTFSQRSPRRFFKSPEAEPPPPPFSLALVTPSESRSRVLRTPPPQPVSAVSTQYESKRDTVPPVSTATSNGSVFESQYRLPPPYSQPEIDNAEQENQGHHSDSTVYNDFSKQNVQTHNVVSDSNISGYDKFTSGTSSSHARKAGYELYSNAENRVVHSNIRGIDNRRDDQDSVHERPAPRLAFVKERNGDNCDSLRKNSGSTQSEENPLSTNEWYNTPANLDYHIVSSVQKSTSDIHRDFENSEFQSTAFDSQRKFDNREAYDGFSTENAYRFDPNLPDFIPIQKRQNQENKMAVQRQDVASRLRSVFFKDSNNVEDSKSSSGTPLHGSESAHSDSGIGSHSNPSSSRSNIMNNLSSASGGQTSSNSQSDLIDGSQNRREPRMHTPPQRDTVSYNGVHSNSAIRTEKLHTGSAFSPVHPQPVTSVKVNKAPISRDQHPVLKLREPIGQGQDASQRQRNRSADSDHSPDPR